MKWISVDERLPKPLAPPTPVYGEQGSDYVLVFSKEYGQIEAYYDFKEMPRGFIGPSWYSKVDDSLQDVTHWMPLPAPPKAQS